VQKGRGTIHAGSEAMGCSSFFGKPSDRGRKNTEGLTGGDKIGREFGEGRHQEKKIGDTMMVRGRKSMCERMKGRVGKERGRGEREEKRARVKKWKEGLGKLLRRHE